MIILKRQRHVDLDERRARCRDTSTESSKGRRTTKGRIWRGASWIGSLSSRETPRHRQRRGATAQTHIVRVLCSRSSDSNTSGPTTDTTLDFLIEKPLREEQGLQRSAARSCDHEEGEGLRSGGEQADLGRMASRRSTVVSGEVVKSKPAPPRLHRRLRRNADRACQPRSEDRGHHCRDGPTERDWTSSAKCIRRGRSTSGIAEEHAVTFSGGLGDAGDEAGRGDLLDVFFCKRALRSGVPRRRHHGSAGWFLHSIAEWHRRRGRSDASRHLRHGLPADLPQHDLHGSEGRETSCGTCSRRRSRQDIRPRCAIPAEADSA